MSCFFETTVVYICTVSGSYSGVCTGSFTRAVHSAGDVLGSHESQGSDIFLSWSHGEGVVLLLC